MKCPICTSEMGEFGIGPVCNEPDCPVLDDYKLWSKDESGTWVRAEGPKAKLQREVVVRRFKLDPTLVAEAIREGRTLIVEVGYDGKLYLKAVLGPPTKHKSP